MKLLYLIAPLLLMGCASKPTPIYIPTMTKVQCPDIAKPAGIDPLPVKFVKAQTEKGDYVLGLDGQQYSNLAINTTETIRYIKEQKLLLEYYRMCIIQHNEIAKEKAPE